MRKGLPLALFLAAAVMLCAGTQVQFKEPRALPLVKHGTPSELVASESLHELPALGSRNPRTLDEVVLTEGFETTADNTLPAGWTQVDVDGGTCAQFGGQTSQWRARTYTAHTGTKICFNHYNDGALPNNDWLILPQQNLSGTITLSYWIASQDPNYLEEYEVKVSTTGTAPANFTNMIFSATNIPTTFTQHTHDLSQFAGAPFYIAFHYNSIDEFVIRLDDVVLEAGAATPRGAIRGVVTDATDGSPLQNAAVAVLGTSLTATTSALGAYLITGIPVDTYTVSFERASYIPMEVTDVIVIANDTVQVDAAMQPSNNIIEEGFEGLADNTLPTGWTQVDVDGGTCAQFAGQASEWRARTYSAHTGTKICFNHYNDGALPNNDWLILPQQHLADTIMLSYWIASQDVNYLESYEVKVSTTGTLPANFTNLIFSATDIPTTFTQHTHDLSQFAGTPFYIAFHYNSIDEFVIRLDDVVLSGNPWSSAGEPSVPSSFAFHGNYPNPFNARTEFRFTLDRAGAVELVLYNVVGQEVARVVNGTLSAGSHTVPFDASALPSGLYLARLTATGHTAVAKTVLLK